MDMISEERGLKRGGVENEPDETIGLATIDCLELTDTLLQVLDYILPPGLAGISAKVEKAI
jgi:hypothetical protein